MTKSVLILFVSYGLHFSPTDRRVRTLAAMHRAHFTMASTAAAAKAVPKFRYLSAWFCPFAHRATLALEHHADRVDYEWVEVRMGLAPASRLSTDVLGVVRLFLTLKLSN